MLTPKQRNTFSELRKLRKTQKTLLQTGHQTQARKIEEHVYDSVRLENTYSNVCIPKENL